MQVSKIYLNGPMKTKSIQLIKTWEDAIREYTKRNLTVKDDRLVAVAGYATSKHKEFRGLGIKNRYLPGIWEQNLVDHLLWISKVKPPPPRPTLYRAPTLSWASIDEAVEFVMEERKGSRLSDVTIQLLDVSLATSPVNPLWVTYQVSAELYLPQGSPKSSS